MDALRHGKFRLVTLLSVICLGLAIAGCEGDDGDDGAPGAAGADGSDGLACWDLNGNGVGDFVLDFPPGTEDLNDDGVFDSFDCNALAGPPPAGGANPVESCSVCHSAGSIGDAVAAHALPPIESGSNVTFAVNGADLDVTFDLTADGVAATGYDEITRFYRYDGTTTTRGDNTVLTLAENATAGNYTITVPGGAADAATDSRYLFRVGVAGDSDTTVYFYGDFPATPASIDAPVVSAEACVNCHGDEGIDVHGGYFAAVDGAEPCFACHGAEDSPFGPAPGPNPVPSLGEVAHGYHSGLYEEETGEITYPTYMNNCSVCHEPVVNLAAANSMPIIAEACFSCHGDITGIPFDEAYAGLHANMNEATNCQGCHVDGGIAGTVVDVTDVHNGAITGNDGVIWDGEDTSVTEGAKIAWTITDVADDGTDLTITWEATYTEGGVTTAVDPCNASGAAGAPVFFADGEGNLSILRNYAQGEDFILGTDPDAAGQPDGNVGVNDTNTTCSGNVATTVVPVEETDAMYGRVGIQGKPRVPNVDPDPDPDFAEEYGTLMPVRAKSPTYDWVVGVGGAAPARRVIVDTAGKCLKCHVGSMYQHGGNRVDNVDLCYLCHNPAANDQYVRAGMGVDASEAYDGQAGELFGMKTMLHAVHASGRSAYSDIPDEDEPGYYRPAEIPFVIYRGRGIYAWAGDQSVVPNWPTELDCVYGNNNTPASTVFGSDADTATVRTCQPHNFHRPTFPRGLYDCGACHDDSFNTLFPDPTKAMASTVEAGDAPYDDQLNDVLEGASSASCMSCHKQWSSADKVEYNALGSHAAQNGWEPQAFEEGRQTIIDANQ